MKCRFEIPREESGVQCVMNQRCHDIGQSIVYMFPIVTHQMLPLVDLPSLKSAFSSMTTLTNKMIYPGTKCLL
jgi:hypothetical protein